MSKTRDFIGGMKRPLKPVKASSDQALKGPYDDDDDDVVLLYFCLIV